MEAKEKIRLAEKNIRQALEDYGRHTSETEALQDVSEVFIRRLAKDNYYAKQELRELFRKSPVWNEELDALVINGTRTHDPDYHRINDLAWTILERPMQVADMGTYWNIKKAIGFFSNPCLSEEEKAEAITALNTIAPKAYAPNKKRTRVFRALCVALGVNDETCERFSYLYAQIADEMTSHKIDFKLFVSLNPAHFITMSNPKHDKRGSTLTSCHSFNSTEYSYNNGCTGYARDKYTFIVFTVVDPTNAETLNNRKNMRQIFCYKPGNGVLLQSRLYNDAGGTYREMAESKVYRDLVQREISALEEQPNLWRTFKYYGNTEIDFSSGYDFGGYEDWTYEEFCAKVSIRADHEGNYQEFEIGTSGLCICCGAETSEGLYCDECSHSCTCDECGERFDDDSLYTVHNCHGDTVEVCEYCRDRYYRYCDNCGEYHPVDDMTEDIHGNYVCSACLDHTYIRCDHCEEWVKADNINTAVNANGYEIYVCDDCLEHYVRCNDCETWVYEGNADIAYLGHGREVCVCPCCRDNYAKCEDCGRLFQSDLLVDGICSDCAMEIANADDGILREEIA